MQHALSNILLVVLLFSAIAVIGLVLIQQSSGGMGGLTGGSSSSLFGARGAGNFLTKMTTIFATVFFITCIALAYLYTGSGDRLSQDSSVIDSISDEQGVPTIESPAALEGESQDGATQGDVPLLNVTPEGEEADSDSVPTIEVPKEELEVPKSESQPDNSQLKIEEAIETVEKTSEAASTQIEAAGVEVLTDVKEATNSILQQAGNATADAVEGAQGLVEENLPEELSAESLLEAVEKEKNAQ